MCGYNVGIKIGIYNGGLLCNTLVSAEIFKILVCVYNEGIKIVIYYVEVLGTTLRDSDRLKLGLRNDQIWDHQIVPLKFLMV